MDFVYNNGNKTGKTRDCVCRAISIATGLPYTKVYERLSIETGRQRASKKTPKRAQTASHGINTNRKWFKDYMKELGFEWVSCMSIGGGCKTHMKKDELPNGTLIVKLSRHMACVIDGTLHDNHDCTRNGSRCVYGYYKLNAYGEAVL